MTARAGYLVVALGAAIAYVGSLQALLAGGTFWTLVIWVSIGASGLLVIGSGTTMILKAPGDTPSPNPEAAPGKTDSPFGPR